MEEKEFFETVEISSLSRDYIHGALLYECALIQSIDPLTKLVDINKIYHTTLAISFYHQAVSTSQNKKMIRGWNDACQFYNLKH